MFIPHLFVWKQKGINNIEDKFVDHDDNSLSYAMLHDDFYGAVRKMTFLKKLFYLANNITVDVMSASVLLVDYSKTKLYLITNNSSYKILREFQS